MLVNTVGNGMGLVSDEALARIQNLSGGSTDTTLVKVKPVLNDLKGTLKAHVDDCTSSYSPYTFPDPFSQAMVRNELTKCQLTGLQQYYATVEPNVAKAMNACSNDAAAAVSGDVFVSTESLVKTLNSVGNVWSKSDNGMTVVTNASGKQVASQVDDTGVLLVTTTDGQTGYLNSAKRRVMHSVTGGFIPLSQNLEMVLQRVETDVEGEDDLVTTFIKQGDAYIDCQIKALKTSHQPEARAATIKTCGDGDAQSGDDRAAMGQCIQQAIG